MNLLSQPPTIGLTLSSIFAEHVEASKQTLRKKVELPSITPWSPMRVRGTFHWNGVIQTLCWWSLEGDHTDSDKAKIHLPILPVKIGIDNMCLITSNFEYTMHSAFNK
jgi:hypothetical protein